MDLNYPSGVDLLWVCTDRVSNVAALITSGDGPIPTYLIESCPDLLYLEESVLRLPLMTRAELLVDVPRPDSFLAIAERGIYVFDWGEFLINPIGVHQKYRIVARPVTPLNSEFVADKVLSRASLVKFDGIEFAHCQVIDVASELPCSNG